MDPEFTRQVSALLATAIGALLEDAAADALKTNDGGTHAITAKALRLQTVGRDVLILAAAVAVVARRTSTPS
jgi:hypothetical protein